MLTVKRHYHFLSKKRGNKRPKYVVFFDTETNETILPDKSKQITLRLGCALKCELKQNKHYVVKDKLLFYDIETFWNWINKISYSGRTTHIVAHNLNFDLCILDAFSQLEQREWLLQSFYCKGLTGIFRWKKDKARLSALDNGNFHQGTLKSWGDRLNLPKLPVDFKGDEEQLITYCWRDVEILRVLWENWMQFLNEHKLGDFCPTVASTALSAFRTRFMTSSIQIHPNKEVLTLERASYKGGRTECFVQKTLNNDHYYSVDINSMYPYVMLINKYPTQLYGYTENSSISRLKELLKHYAVVAEVSLKIDKPVFPMKYQGHTCYPIGYLKTTLTSEELLYALKNNWVKSVSKIAHYKQRFIFREYVGYFYNLKLKYGQQSDKLLYKLAKLFLNSLYGKFAQTGLEQRILGSVENIPPFVISKIDYKNRLTDESNYSPVYDVISGYTHPDDLRYEYVTLGGQIIYREYSGESYNSFPAIASHVTGNARLFLYSLIEKAGKENVYYCDTDSLWVNTEGLENLTTLLDDTELGKLKIEKEASELIINAPKDYSYDGLVRLKGIKSNSTKISESVYEQEQWPKIPGQIRKGDINNYVIKTVRKHLKREIFSGIVEYEGTIIPFYFPPNFHSHLQEFQDYQQNYPAFLASLKAVFPSLL